jgi:hypothetical protein
MQLSPKGEVKGNDLRTVGGHSRFQLHCSGTEEAKGRKRIPGCRLKVVRRVSLKIKELKYPSGRPRAMATTTDGKTRVVTGITVLGLTGSIGKFPGFLSQLSHST